MLLRAGAKRLAQAVLPALSGGSCSTATRGIQYFDAPNGPAVTQTPIEDEWYNRQRNLLPLLDKVPWVQPDTWVAPNAVVTGDVDIYDKVGGAGGRVQGARARWHDRMHACARARTRPRAAAAPAPH